MMGGGRVQVLVCVERRVSLKASLAECVFLPHGHQLANCSYAKPRGYLMCCARGEKPAYEMRWRCLKDRLRYSNANRHRFRTNQAPALVPVPPCLICCCR